MQKKISPYDKIMHYLCTMDSPIFDTLLQLPLFQGMATDDFNTLLQKIRLDFMRYPAGSYICKAGDTCKHFTFLIGGTVESSRNGDATLDRALLHVRYHRQLP